PGTASGIRALPLSAGVPVVAALSRRASLRRPVVGRARLLGSEPRDRAQDAGLRSRGAGAPQAGPRARGAPRVEGTRVRFRRTGNMRTMRGSWALGILLALLPVAARADHTGAVDVEVWTDRGTDAVYQPGEAMELP